jgi:hypothetical protein
LLSGRQRSPVPGRLSSRSPVAALSPDSIDRAPSFVVRKQPVVARASWLTSSCSSFAWPMVRQVWRGEDNRTGIHICTSPTPSGAYPTTSRRTYTYSPASVFVHPPIRLLPSDPTLRLRPPALCSPHAHHPFPFPAQPVSSARSPISLGCTAHPQTGLGF